MSELKQLLDLFHSVSDHPAMPNIFEAFKHRSDPALVDRFSRVDDQLSEIRKTLASMESKIMAGIDNLAQQITRIGTDVSQIGAALAAHPAASDDAQLQQMATQLSGIGDQLESVTAGLTGSAGVTSSGTAAGVGDSVSGGGATDTASGGAAG